MDCGFHDCGLQVHVYLAPKVDLADSYRGSGHGSHETLHVRACVRLLSTRGVSVRSIGTRSERIRQRAKEWYAASDMVG
jgi:hypothetical protein